MKYLRDINWEVMKTETGYRVVYTKDDHSGYCDYNIIRGGRFQPGDHLVLIGCEMGEIVECINKITPLDEKDFVGIDREIREDSLFRIDHHRGGIRK